MIHTVQEFDFGPYDMVYTPEMIFAMSLLRQKEGLAEDRSRDEKTQLIVGCIGSAADIIEFVSETVGDVPDQLCNGNLLQNFTLINLNLLYLEWHA